MLIEMPKQRLQITVREDLVKWIDTQIKSLRFANRSHTIEFALLELKNSSEKKKE